jgi:flagellin-like hook-associated protein FlgL
VATMAKEMMEFTKMNILAQAANAMLEVRWAA